MAALVVLAGVLTVIGLTRFAFPSFREGTYRRGYLWYLRLGEREELGLAGPPRAKLPSIHPAVVIAVTAAAGVGLLVLAALIWVGGYVVVGVVAGIIGVLVLGIAVDDLRENRYLRGGTSSSTIEHPVSLEDRAGAEAIDLLFRDIHSTLGWDHERVEAIVVPHIEHGAWMEERQMDSHARIHWLVESVQQELHDTFVDTTWPACPLHHHHPLWLHVRGEGELVWWCESANVIVALLGSLGSAEGRAEPRSGI